MNSQSRVTNSGDARRHEWRRAFVVFAAALLVKAVVLVALRGHPLLQPRGDMDTTVYVALAQHVPAETFFVSPLYVYFLRTVDASLLAARILQILLGSVAVALIFDTARRWFRERAALVSAALAILTGVISFYEVTILQAALDPFLVALSLWLLTLTLTWRDGDLAAQGRVRLSPTLLAGAAGISAGLLVLNRPNALLWIPLLVAGLLWLRMWRPAAAIVAGFLIAILPVTIRNYVVAHEVVLIASHGGLNFYIGNNPAADGTYHHVPGIRPTIAGQEEDARTVAAAALGRHTVTAGEASSYFFRRSLEWMESNPGAALRLFFRKLAYTFNQTDLALNYSYSYFSRDVRSPLMLLIAGPWILFPLGIAGAALHLRNRQFAVWALFIPAYAISVALFFVSSRYRLPLLIPMCVTAGAMFVRPRVWAWAVAVVLAVAVLWNFGLDDGRAHDRTNMAVYLIEQHRFDEAASLIEQTAAMTRDRATLYLRSAGAYEAAGDPERSLDALTHIDPDRATPDARAEAARMARNFGVAFVRGERGDRALTAFTTAHRLEPENASDLLNMAVLEAQRGNIAAARDDARAALALRPGYPQAEGLLRAIE